MPQAFLKAISASANAALVNDAIAVAAKKSIHVVEVTTPRREMHCHTLGGELLT